MADKYKRCLAGADQFLSSEVVIGGGHLACNNSFADWWRVHFSEHASEVTACLKKSKSWTGVTRIGGALWYTSWASTDRAAESSSCEQVTRMSAHSRLSYSDRGLRG